MNPDYDNGETEFFEYFDQMQEHKQYLANKKFLYQTTNTANTQAYPKKTWEDEVAMRDANARRVMTMFEGEMIALLNEYDAGSLLEEKIRELFRSYHGRI